VPFKSRAQRRKFASLLMSGDITPEQYERWNRETGRAELPERVKPRRKPKSKSKRSRRASKRKPAPASKTRLKRKRTSRTRPRP
jgi:hypothetical protein